MKTYISLVLLFAFSTFQFLSAEKRNVGILPFENKSGKELEWLSQAIADTLAAKLSNRKKFNLIERSQLLSLIEVAKQGSLQVRDLQAIRADFLILGSYVVHKKQIMISARMVEVESGRIEKKTLVKVSGLLENILKLQSQLANVLNQKLEFEADPSRLHSDIAKSYSSYRLFYLGKIAYSKQAYQESIDLLLQAQSKNLGSYFPEAHHWEGRARIALANQAESLKEKKNLQMQSIKKFEKDASLAAPAFYNLGLVYQSLDQHDKAIESFAHYLRWYDQNARPFRWSESRIPLARHLIMTEEGPYFYSHGKREREQSNGASARFSYNWRFWIAEDPYIYFYCARRLNCRRLSDGKTMWSIQLPELQTCPPNSLSAPKLANFLLKRKETLYFSTMSKILVIDAKTGVVRKTINEKVPNPALGRFYVFDRENIMITHIADKQLGRGRMIARDLVKGEIVWERYWPYTVVTGYHQGYMFLCNSDADQIWKLDLKTGEMAAIEHTFKYPIYQIWPAKDHLLIRSTPRYRTYDEDHYFRYDYKTNKIIKDDREILFNSFYSHLPPQYKTAAVPMIDGETGFYRLIDADLFYPRHVVRKMDNHEDRWLKSDKLIPWSRLRGDRLFCWTNDHKIRGYNVNDKTMLWSKFSKQSSAGADMTGNYVIGKNRYATLQIFSSLATPDAERYIDALIKNSVSFARLNRMNDAINSSLRAYNNSNEHVEANVSLARHYLNMGNMNEALEHYTEVLKNAIETSAAYREAYTVLSKQFGLLKVLPYNHLNGFYLYDGILYFCKNSDGKGRSLAYHDIKNNQTELKLVDGALSSWRGRKDSIYYFDYEGAFYHLNVKKKIHQKIFQEDMPSYTKTLNFPTLSTQAKGFELFENIVLYVVKNPNDIGYILQARDLQLGRKLWQFEFSGRLSLSVVDDFLVLTRYYSDKLRSKASITMRLEPKTGKVMWEKDFPNVYSEGAYAFRWQDKMIYTYYETRDGGFYDPRERFFEVDPKTGEILNTDYFAFFNKRLFVDHGKKILFRYKRWGWNQLHNVSIVIDEQFGKRDDYQFYVEDITDRHPKVLAKLVELKPYENEFDLKVQVKALNSILADPHKRTAFINRYKDYIIKLGKRRSPSDQFSPMGNETIMNRLRILLENDERSEEEDKIAMRQLAACFLGRENHGFIKAYRTPSGVRGRDIVVCDPDDAGKTYTLGHFRGRLLGHDLKNGAKNFVVWRQMPKLNYQSGYQHGIHLMSTQGEYMVAHSKSGYYIYKVDQLIQYMKQNITWEHGCFSVDTKALSLKNAVDGDPKTYASLSHPKRVVIGIDKGLSEVPKSLSILPTIDSYPLLENAYVQSSDFSETAGFRNVAILSKGSGDGKSYSVSLQNVKKARYWRVVTQQGGEIKIAEIKFQ